MLNNKSIDWVLGFVMGHALHIQGYAHYTLQ